MKTNTQETAEAISSRLGTHGVQTTSLNYSMSFLNNNGSKGTSLISRRLMTADEIKQLHFKTIIFPTVGYPIFRDTVVYQKFSCYQKGMIERKARPLERLVNTYYTVEQLKFDSQNNNTNNETKLDTEENKKKTRLIETINKVLEKFGKVDSDVEYLKIGKETVAQLYIAPPLSTKDLTNLEELSNKLKFNYNAISDREKVNRTNRNSLIEIFLFDKEKEGVKNE